MAPPAGVRVRGRLRFSRKKVMKRFHDVFGHPHELVVLRGWVHALRHEVANGPRSIRQTKRECCRDTLGEVFRGERFPSGELHHDVGKGESNAA